MALTQESTPGFCSADEGESGESGESAAFCGDEEEVESAAFAVLVKNL